MADVKKPIASNLTGEKLEHMKEYLRTLKEEARTAHANGDLIMLDMYNEVLRVVSPIIQRAEARLDREEKAELNKAEKAMRKKLREEQEAAKKNARPSSA